MTDNLNINTMEPFDMAQQLRDEADVVEYLRQVLEEGESDEFAAALGHTGKAREMTEIAQTSGIQRDALYKALRPHSQPRFDTIQRVCRALGVQLTVNQDH